MRSRFSPCDVEAESSPRALVEERPQTGAFLTYGIEQLIDGFMTDAAEETEMAGEYRQFCEAHS